MVWDVVGNCETLTLIIDKIKIAIFRSCLQEMCQCYYGFAT